MNKKSFSLFSLNASAVIGFLAGWVDFHNNEPQAAALVLLVLGGLLGLTRPKPAWLCAMIAGSGVLLVHLAGKMLGRHWVGSMQPNDFGALLALIPAFMGIYASVGIRKAATVFSEDKNHSNH